MEQLPAIPTPWPQRWREFRIRVLPVLMFALVAVAIAMLWRNLGAPGLSGLGEGTRSIVSSPHPGLMQSLLVKPYQMVQAGEPLAVLRPVDPRVPLDLLQAELQLANLRYQPTPAEQNAMNYERVRADLLRTKAELAIAKVNRERADNEVRRNLPLYQEKLVSEDIYDLSVKTREACQAEIDEKTKAVAEMEERMRQWRNLGDPQSEPVNFTLLQPNPGTPGAPPHPVFRGLCDASAVETLDASLFVVANDEDNLLRTYDRARGGLPLRSLNLSAFLGVDPLEPESDLDRGHHRVSHARRRRAVDRQRRRHPAREGEALQETEGPAAEDIPRGHGQPRAGGGAGTGGTAALRRRALNRENLPAAACRRGVKRSRIARDCAR
ncbi:MAG: hypothetical protein JXQ71_01965 [Verrucomicrobia bacterium]|nr:hypothetical protein [Verrucomicrobiota bacterium]